LTTPGIDRKLNIFVAHPSGLLTDCRPNGDGLLAFGFIQHLAERGHRLLVAVERSDIAGRLPDNVVLHHIGDSDAPTPRPLFMYRMRRLFNRLNRAERFDLVHQLNPVFAGLSLALIGTRTPIVLGTYIPYWPSAPDGSFWSAIHWRMAETVKRAVAALQQRYASALLLTTPAARERISGGASAARKTFMLPNGIDAASFAPADSDGDGLTIVSLCGLGHRKGADVLLEAFKAVASAVPEASLTIGGAVTESEIEQARRRLGSAANRVEFIGAVSRQELPDLLRRSSVFAMPSYQEPYGMAALEAMASGLPVVASDSGGLAYLVPEEGGKKVPEGSATAFATALVELLRDRELRRRCGTYNRVLVLQQFSWPVVIERLESIYATVLRCSQR